MREDTRTKTAKTGRTSRAGRVTTACDFCRKKRLKCTANPRPCMNCQLYGTECGNTTDPTPRKASTSTLQRELNKEMSTPVQSTAMVAAHDLGELHPPPPAAGQNALTESAQFDLFWQAGRAAGPQNGVYEQSLASDNSHQFPSDQAFAQRIDFWNPALALHEDILLGAVPGTPTLSQTFLNDLSAFHPDEDECSHQNHEFGNSSSRQPNVDHEGKVWGVQSLRQKSGPSSSNSHILPGLFIRKDAVNSNFIGLNSMGAILAFSIRESLEAGSGLSKTTSFDYLIGAGPHVGEAGVPSRIDISMDELPAKSLASTSIQAYFSNVHVFYPIIDEERFRATWEEIYDREGLTTRSLDVPSFYLVVAIGAVCDVAPIETDPQMQKISTNLYHQAWNLLNDPLAKPAVSTVQLVLLYVLFMMYHGRSGMAWVLCGLAIRISQAIGLHRRSPRDFDLTEEQIHLRSQLWWVAFGLDATLSMTQGRPTAVSATSYDTEILLPKVQLHVPADADMTVSHLYCWRTKLAQIQNRICGVLNRQDIVTTRLDALAEIDTALTLWRDSIPVGCRPEKDIIVHQDVFHLVALLHLEYYSMLRGLHWASMTSVPPHDRAAEIHPSLRIRASEAICLAAARSFVKTLNEILDYAKYRNAFVISLHKDDYIGALAVLYRSIFKNPGRLSTKLDLEYFRAATVHFERVSSESSLTSTLTNLFGDMLKSAEELVLRANRSAREG